MKADFKLSTGQGFGSPVPSQQVEILLFPVLRPTVSQISCEMPLQFLFQTYHITPPQIWTIQTVKERSLYQLIFFKMWDLERLQMACNCLQNHPTTLELALIDRLHMTSYQFSIVTICLSFTCWVDSSESTCNCKPVSNIRLYVRPSVHKTFLRFQ